MVDNVVPFVRKKIDETFEKAVTPILNIFDTAIIEGKKETEIEYITADIYDITFQLKGNVVQNNRSDILQFIAATHRLFDGEGNTHSMILSAIIDDIYEVINRRYQLVGIYYNYPSDSESALDTLDIELLFYFRFTNNHVLVIGITVGNELPPAA